MSAKPAPASPPAEPEAEIAEDTEPARASRFVQARQTQAGGITPAGRRRLSGAMKKRWAERKRKKS